MRSPCARPSVTIALRFRGHGPGDTPVGTVYRHGVDFDIIGFGVHGTPDLGEINEVQGLVSNAIVRVELASPRVVNGRIVNIPGMRLTGTVCGALLAMSVDVLTGDFSLGDRDQ